MAPGAAFLTTEALLGLSFFLAPVYSAPFKQFTNCSTAAPSQQTGPLTDTVEIISTVRDDTVTTVYEESVTTVRDEILTTVYEQSVVTVSDQVFSTVSVGSVNTVENEVVTTVYDHVVTTVHDEVVTTVFDDILTTVFDDTTQTVTQVVTDDEEATIWMISTVDIVQAAASTPAVNPTPASLPSVSPSTLQPSTVVVTDFITEVYTVYTALETTGVVTSAPLLSFSSGELSPTTTLSPTSLTQSSVVLNATSATAPANGTNPFRAIATNALPSQIQPTANHPVPTANIVASKEATIETNKFYANLFLGSEDNSVFTFPYTINWANGTGGTASYGMAVSHVMTSQRVTGPTEAEIPEQPVQFYVNPLNEQQVVLGANELGKDTKLTVDSPEAFSVNANLYPNAAAAAYNPSSSKITFPLVQGMGFFTGIYDSLQPEIRTVAFFSSVTSAGSIGNAYKWRITLQDGSDWLMYAIPQDASTETTFQMVSSNLLQGPQGWSGIIQVAQNSANSTGESIFDGSAGIYPTKTNITGLVNGKSGSYSLAWTLGGQSAGNASLLQFALPHHVASFDSRTSAAVKEALTLQTTTKGVATAVVANKWTMVEDDLPNEMTFTPWTPTNGTTMTYSSTAINAIYSAAQIELQQNIAQQTNVNSMYYAGKAFSKFASILIAVQDICQQNGLAQQGLDQLKEAFAVFTNNTQDYPLVYDEVWKGVVSSASYPDKTNDPGSDFGNTYYNDHHFHYGYFLHTAAVIGHLDPSWVPANKDWVNALARDVNNPSASDSYFPMFRNFDWYHGHSFAKGLFESGDGKDEESSSEDVMFSYGLKLWGSVVKDASMEARGNLMLAVQARSLQSYFLLEDNNVNQPADFIGNKVTGILFENKVDHTTYFGTNLEYIQGIHMLPLIPASAITRTATFVKQEWDTYFATGAVDDANNVQGGWKGILFANLALTDPVTSWNFFASPDFDSSWLDGGASRTWYLAFAAGLGGAPA